MNEKEKNIKKYDSPDIEKYLQGKLSPDEMHAIEKSALEDPFLADAIDGIQQSLQKQKDGSFDQDIKELNQRLKERVAAKRKTIPLWTRAAAAVLILAIGASIAYYFIQKNITNESPIALKRKQNVNPSVDSSITPAPIPSSAKTDTIILESENARKADNRINPDLAKANQKKSDHIKLEKDTPIPSAGLAAREEQIVSKNEAPKASPVIADKEKMNDKKSSDYSSAQGNSNSFEGKVTDQNNRPIASASVELKDKNITTITDHNGNFKLNIKDPDSVMDAKVSSAGYEAASISLNNNGSNAIVLKRQNKSSLQEVVSAYRGKYKAINQTNQDAEPVKGWDEYNQYLEKNKKTPQDSLGLKGVVVISFTVKKNGKPSDFSVEQSLGKDYDAEAIRLIKEGASWKLLKGKKAIIKVNVIF
ncbi:MAG TPA: carboxypeptidase-like regulatory domain-containing protein [Puia sp.]|nr:carboxypeptidase-like regulatory domain-containing protein [Puia sp.]